jgi:hypothetical protein
MHARNFQNFCLHRDTSCDFELDIGKVAQTYTATQEDEWRLFSEFAANG